MKLNALYFFTKTVDFRREKPELQPITIKGQPVETVKSYKYLGMVIDDKLDWTEHIRACCKKGNQRLFFLRKLKKFRVDPKIMSLFFQSVVQSVTLYNIVCFLGSAKKTDVDQLGKIIRTAERIIKEELPSINSIYEKTAIRKLNKIRSDPSHPLHPVLTAQTPARSASRRLRSFKCRTNRFLDSYLPSAVRLLNATT
ncbi:uncharacterized protein [Littorina saxatilis]|uniref:uncharacterized protein n=1 Tax=Littorina saxatilis TaxID=31220 RepID=UPI0038B52D0C